MLLLLLLIALLLLALLLCPGQHLCLLPPFLSPLVFEPACFDFSF
jgi:hypothetical protein